MQCGVNMVINNKFKFRLLLAMAILAFTFPQSLMATFSIVAVDTTNGAVGGAGASCIDNSYMINDMIENVGAVHTQAWYLAANQLTARNRLVAGDTPQEIIDWMITHDAEGTPDMRQYGVVTLAGPGASAAYTGSATTIWREHATGPGYSIQGNILLGPEIVANMKAAFLATEGPLEDKLMAAMNAADVDGADIRCASCDKPAISAFIKVLHPGDGLVPYLAINIPTTTCPVNPMDSLRLKFAEWKLRKQADAVLSQIVAEPDTIAATGEETAFITITPLNFEGNPPTEGSSVELTQTGGGTLSEVTDNGDGTFSAFIVSPAAYGRDTITAFVTAGGIMIELDQKAIVQYYRCGDASGDGMINLLDILYVISSIYDKPPGPDPVPPEAGDANGDGNLNLIDILYLIDFVYSIPPGAAPVCPE